MTTQVQSWEPFAKESTLEVLTIDQTTQEHWSKFWLVVIDEEMYLRLGSRGADCREYEKPFRLDQACRAAL